MPPSRTPMTETGVTYVGPDNYISELSSDIIIIISYVNDHP